MRQLGVCFIAFSYSWLLWAISPEAVVSSSLQHFPQVIEAIQNVVENESDVVESEGSFDSRIKAGADMRSEGFYSGDAYKLSVEKPLPFLNSRVSVGKRQSYGSFPSYEGEFETQTGGEVFAGVSVSLLRNSLIDSNRYNIRWREQKAAQSKINLEQVRINVQTMALEAYWTWFIKGHENRVYQEILNLAEKRASKIAKRIKAGDLAKIYESENGQYIQKRKVQVLKSQLEFQESAFYLSLFLRDKNGAPRTLSEKDLPLVSEQTLARIVNVKDIYQKAMAMNLDLQILASKEKQAELDIRMGTNDILPKADVSFEWNQDQGPGPNRLAGDENRIMLNVEIPLEFNRGLGKRRAGKAKAAKVKTKKKWALEKLRVRVRSLTIKINSFAEMFEVTKNEVKLAQKLAKAEQRKFSQGASDLILVNLREENMAQAQVSNLSTLLKYYLIDAKIKNIKVEFMSN